MVELTLALAETMCELAQIDADPASVLASGAAMDKWRSMISAQGGDPDAPLPTAPHIERIEALAEVPAALLSVGPGREETIIVRELFD